MNAKTNASSPEQNNHGNVNAESKLHCADQKAQHTPFLSSQSQELMDKLIHNNPTLKEDLGLHAS